MQRWYQNIWSQMYQTSGKNITINFIIKSFKEQYGNEVLLAGQFNFSVTKMDESKKA